MDIKTYCIALGRLAPVQISTWGHSDTSGLPNIDYFVSSKYFETEKSDNNYSEKLIKMDSLGTYYFDINSYIAIPKFDIINIRTKLNLPLNLNMYLAPFTLFKIHEEYDEIIEGILRNDENGFIVFIEGNKPKIQNLFYQRLNKKLGKLINQVYFVPYRKVLLDFLKLLACSDVIIDSYPFGGCNVSFESFSLGKIVITRPSNFINGRFTHGLYQKMGITNVITNTNKEFIEKATYYANNKNERNKLEKMILNNKHKIFETQESVDEWNKFLESVINN